MRGSSARSPRYPGPSAQSPSLVEPGAPDWGLLGLVLVLSTWGLVMVFSASALDSMRRAQDFSDQFSLLLRQMTSFGVGAIAMTFFMLVPYRRLRGPVLLMALVAIFVMLALLLFPNPLRGEPGPGGIAYRWLLDGPLRFQPAELAKFVLVVWAATFLEKKAPFMKGEGLFRYGAGYVFIFLAAAGMILKEPDLGTAMVVAGTCFFMLVLAGIEWRWLGLAFVAGVSLVYAAARVSPYRWKRITSWLDPWSEAHGDAYQAVQGLIALAKGGWFGVGLGQGVQKLGYLPEKHTDFIFAVIAEELGLVGGLVLLALFACLAWMGYGIAARAPDRFSSLLASGMTTVLVFQAFMNIGVVSGLLPVTGVPLPFISFGGTSMITSLAAVGVLLGVSRYCTGPPTPERERAKAT